MQEHSLKNLPLLENNELADEQCMEIAHIMRINGVITLKDYKILMNSPMLEIRKFLESWIKLQNKEKSF